MWWAERARLYVWSPEFHDCCCDFPLIQHPQALCSLFLSIFSIFPVGSCCAQLGQLVKRGNEERRVDLGPLIDDGGGRCDFLSDRVGHGLLFEIENPLDLLNKWRIRIPILYEIIRKESISRVPCRNLAVSDGPTIKTIRYRQISAGDP